ncbi:uncharacterized protein PHALS_04983 [Plasmopara halstedii]|uniref:Uncharacterized protein n=1 Tax=Plasmopara halstedii TaxID=4781 RepID=A0A0P1AAV7_PLAHL|nr:uncharacterized protein PHALS_04983 [Plasmopara halstedii]CEG37389.1 hypothetical protein PHALS_04983 [Plasmopara halstedii]|eukprot:XP_024573758.1 hypothetical protein PHALS_04983 [Plasmopara halstedii]
MIVSLQCGVLLLCNHSHGVIKSAGVTGSIDAIRNFVIFVRRSIKQRQQLNAIARH